MQGEITRKQLIDSMKKTKMTDEQIEAGFKKMERVNVRTKWAVMKK